MPKIIDVPKITFIVGDHQSDMIFKFHYYNLNNNVRPLYGPEDEKGERKLVGLVSKDIVEQLSGMIDFADATMPPKDD